MGTRRSQVRFFPGPNGTVRVTDFAGTVVAGTNCVQESASTVRCSRAKHINADGRDGDDVLDGGSNADQPSPTTAA